jgi:hypothetical protein
VRVAVEGELYAGVPGEVLDELGVHASPEKQSEARMPEIMPANIGQSCSLEQGLEMAVDDVLRVERCPLGGSARTSYGDQRGKIVCLLDQALTSRPHQRDRHHPCTRETSPGRASDYTARTLSVRAPLLPAVRTSPLTRTAFRSDRSQARRRSSRWERAMVRRRVAC